MPKTQVESIQHAGSITTPDARDLRTETKGFMDTMNRSWYYLSKNLHEIYEHRAYEGWGFSNFREYVENELNLPYRIAMYRVNMGRVIETYRIEEEAVTGMGWSKFKEVCAGIESSMSRGEVDNLIESCKDKTLEQVEDYIKEVRTSRVGQQIDKKVMIKCLVVQEAAEVIEAALTDVANLIGQDASTGIRLEFICQSYLANNNPELKDAILASLKSTKAEEAEKATTKLQKEHINKGRKRATKKKKG